MANSNCSVDIIFLFIQTGLAGPISENTLKAERMSMIEAELNSLAPWQAGKIVGEPLFMTRLACVRNPFYDPVG
jgi:hypothetical protein